VTDASEAGGRSYAPGSHYDRVTEAWTLLLGEELHYGVFETGDEALSTATAELTQRMIEASGLQPGAAVLDVGCGTGAPACQLALEHSVRVTGITTSRVGVEAARRRAAAAGVDALVTFDERDGMENGFPEASFDVVWALESSHLMRRRDRLISECARVLRPGGRLALCDIVLRREMPFTEVRRLREPLGLLRDVFGDARMEALARYAELAVAEGLQVEEQADLTAATRSTFARWRENAEGHREEVVASLGEDDWQRFVDAAGVLERFWDEGVLGYGLLAASKPTVRQ
jgi:cyclopropane fatty-acyl-phospholipid synthase-like methyltransferase